MRSIVDERHRAGSTEIHVTYRRVAGHKSANARSKCTDGHRSPTGVVFVHRQVLQHHDGEGDHPRPIQPALPEVPKATAQEILAVYGPFVANTGTYEINRSELIMHPMVSKNPELMGGSVIYFFEIQGNSLTVKMLKMVMGANVPPPPLPPVIWTLTRVE